MTVKFYEVGGCVRDDLLGLGSKDVDFVCVAPSFEAMENYLRSEKFTLFLVQPDFGTIRCRVPNAHPLSSRCKVADFVLARKDGPTADGRRPEYTEPGTLADDLARRDFTVNALARCPGTGYIIDHHGGLEDLENRRLRFVGDPMERIREDGLRVLRGWRFHITKALVPTLDTFEALTSDEAAEMLACVSLERVRDELEKMFAYDNLATLKLLSELSDAAKAAVFRAPLRLKPTLKEK